MASVFFAPSIPLLREQSKYWSTFSLPSVLQLRDTRFHHCCIRAVSKKKASQFDAKDSSSEDDLAPEDVPKVSRRPSTRSKKKTPVKTPDDDAVTSLATKDEEGGDLPDAPAKLPKKISRKGRKKVTASAPSSDGETLEAEAERAVAASETDKTEKKVGRRRTKKKVESADDEITAKGQASIELPQQPPLAEDEEDLLLTQDEGEDSSFTCAWPPLVCCFGAAQHGFIPSGRPANRLIDHDIHETKRDMFWSPDKFVRSPGSSASGVALALASLGGRVEFMGKLGDDEYGQTVLYHLNANQVQTRSIKIDASKPTAVSRMKLARRGGLKTTCTKPCAEDSFLSSEVNVDVLKEAKMFYFNSSSLLNENLRRTAMRAVKASKKLGGVIFFDLNLPLPLWQSNEETKAFIKEAWECADIAELTKQELEFLCGIEPVEEFDTKNNAKSKFAHHKYEAVKSLWHENLKVLFVTNGTSKIHYYTEKDEGWVRGMEDAPITPFTGDMSASGDAIVAALMRMLSVQPHLATDKGYLEHVTKYAITCGVIDQWTASRVYGFPPKEGFEGVPDENGVRSISENEFRTVGSFAD